MKAAVINCFGSTSVIEIVDMPVPHLRSDEVLVRVRAAAINPKDTFIRKGRLERFTGNRFPMQMGFDFAGEVVKAGDQVIGIQKSESVYGMLDGWGGGTCAEYVAVKTSQLARKPESSSFKEAAALPMATLTALQALRDEANIKVGMKVCINGASGGVGSMAVQIANISGAAVTAISSTINHDFLQEVGAETCVDYHDRDIKQTDHRFDIFFDVFGNQRFQSIKPILSKNGVWVSTVLQPHVFYSVARTKIFSSKKAKLVMVKSSTKDLRVIRNWVDAGQLKPIIHDVYPLDKIQQAHAQQETKHTRGKVVVSI
ncbi:MAG: NAD(P)-dependent alcohol dehydrogenase [Anaerolineales bacterium]